MNEEALQQLYTLAQGEGYSKSFDDFKVLMSSNEDALNNCILYLRVKDTKRA
jgi:hypothetical protein